MRVWITCFVVLFVLVQLFDWVKQISLPLPICILGGALLAVASNYEKMFGSYGLKQSFHGTIEPSTEQLKLDSPPLTSASVTLTGSSIEDNPLELKAKE
ncbi:MAG: hypothetical protein QNJ36_00050 [Calothrix sp. MO_167.B42]|nr:hypothetical protein [Calothrix sp. MO_167.B42]